MPCVSITICCIVRKINARSVCAALICIAHIQANFLGGNQLWVSIARAVEQQFDDLVNWLRWVLFFNNLKFIDEPHLDSLIFNLLHTSDLLLCSYRGVETILYKLPLDALSHIHHRRQLLPFVFPNNLIEHAKPLNAALLGLDNKRSFHVLHVSIVAQINVAVF